MWEGKTFLEAPRLPEDRSALGIARLAQIARDYSAYATSPGIANETGAGISAESGVPTFRGDGGLWKNFKPEELATQEAFARDPKLVWEIGRAHV